MHHPNHDDSHHHLPEDFEYCVAFHGHQCPGLVYGYRVAKKAIELLGLDRSRDEEVVAISENDTCAIDALQLLLGTTMGKGNLILHNYGKNVFTILNRSDKRAFRFSRRHEYTYDGEHPEEFAELEAAYADGDATTQQRSRQKLLKSLDLLSKPFEAVFDTEAVEIPEPSYAPLAPSEACAECGEMTMSTKLVEAHDGRRLCIPCAEISKDLSED
jgi:formylmethanofuran dehydrogenase subunit E